MSFWNQFLGASEFLGRLTATHTLFELAVLEPTFTLGHSSSKNDSTNLDTYKKQSSTWQKPKIGFVQFGSRVE